MRTSSNAIFGTRWLAVAALFAFGTLMAGCTVKTTRGSLNERHNHEHCHGWAGKHCHDHRHGPGHHP